MDLGARDEASTWKLLFDAHNQYAGAGLTIPYLLLTENSNTYVNTLLSIIGLNVTDYISRLDLPTIYDPMTGAAAEFHYPGVGANVIHRVAPSFTLNGGASNDVINTGVGNDTLNGRGGNDSLSGAAGNDSLNGAAGNDTLYGGDDIDSLVGGAGADLLDGGRGADLLDGGAGTDILRFDEDDFVFGGGGRDVAYMSSFPQSVTEQPVALRGARCWGVKVNVWKRGGGESVRSCRGVVLGGLTGAVVLVFLG